MILIRSKMNFEFFLFAGLISTVSYLGVRLLIWLYRYYQSVKKINKMKGPPMIPFIGNTQFDLNKSNLSYN